MAIVDGKRIKGVHFFKVRSRKEWVAYDTSAREVIALCAQIGDDESPLTARFHYCSPFGQPVFMDSFHCAAVNAPFLDKGYVRASWRTIPEDWREMFRRYWARTA